ncbi:hypothetical protein GCM10010994_60910 [Chelatococcus reniformis]|uniref:Transposase IS4-like domain-containing protein n=1 Tax=Chelatococcus reniformis TaxID=1494448 RepID=A0A916UYM3_9HYPH|nr:hypothetical protein GCM10010994_60910 [Chelatococcus reniformis]
MDTLGHRLALHVTPASDEDRSQVGRMAEAIKAATDESVDIAFVDQGYTGERAAKAAAAHGIEPEVVKLPDAKRGFVLLPRRWVVERSFAWRSLLLTCPRGEVGFGCLNWKPLRDPTGQRTAHRERADERVQRVVALAFGQLPHDDRPAGNMRG